MSENSLLTFERTPDPEAMEIYCNGEGLRHLIHRLKRLLPRDLSVPDHDHWMAESIGGHDLSSTKHGPENFLYEMVTAHYFPPLERRRPHSGADDGPGSGEDRVLTFVAEPPGGECKIYCTSAGLRRLIERLQTLADSDLTRPFSDVWTKSGPGGGILTSKPWSDTGTLVRRVTLHYRP